MKRLIIILLLLPFSVLGTNKYFNDASGTSIATAANWFTDSTFTTTTTVPTSSDDVYFTAASGASTVTIPSTFTCRSLIMKGFAGSTSGSGGISCNGHIYIRGTWTATGAFGMSVTSGTWDISTNGKTIGSMWFSNGNGNTAVYNMLDNLTMTGALSLASTSLNTNNHNLSCSHIANIAGVYPMGVYTFGSSLVSLTATSAQTTTFSGATNTNVPSNTATFRWTGSNSPTFNGGTVTNFYNLEFKGTVNVVTLTGAFTCRNLILNSGLTTTLSHMVINDNITVTNEFRITGYTRKFYSNLQSNVFGVTKTITCNGNVYLSKVMVRSIVAAGSANWATNVHQVGDMGNNTGVTFTTPRTLYWVNTSGGNWSDTLSWATTSGGTTKVAIPLPQDNVIFDGNSITSGGRTITCDVYSTCKDLVMTNIANNPTFTISVGPYHYGDFILGSNMSVSGNYIVYFRPIGTCTVYTAGKSLPWGFLMESIGGTLQLTDNFTSTFTTSWRLLGGTLDLNGYTMTTAAQVNFVTYAPPTTCAITFGSGTLSISIASSNISFNSANLTINKGTGKLQLTGAPSGKATTLTLNKTFYEVEFTGACSSSGYFTLDLFYADILTLNFSTNNAYLKITSGQTITIGKLKSLATAVKRFSLLSAAASNATISMASGCPADDGTDYTDFTYIVGTGGATWKVGANSTLTNCTGLTAASCVTTNIKAVNSVTQATINKVNSVTNATIKKINSILNQ